MAAGPLLTLLTDFGTADYYVGAMKGTVLRLAPRAQLVDLSHEVPPGDVEAAADLLAGAVPAFPAGTCHLAVVDPGVGSARRMLVVQWRDQQLVAPDNGLLTPFLGEGAAWSVTRTDLFLPAPGATFHGRDRFAPVVAALLRGDHPAALAERIVDPVRLALPEPRRTAGAGGGAMLEGRVARVDRYGNLVTDVPAAWVAVAGGQGAEPQLRVEVAGQAATRRATHYAELPLGEPGVLVGSRGTLELSLRDASLAEAWGVARGAAVRVEVR
jgi:S-adenosylmethionine hydrolase